jgi:hypothetical protein
MRNLAENCVNCVLGGKVYHSDEECIILATNKQPNLIYDHYYISVANFNT